MFFCSISAFPQKNKLEVDSVVIKYVSWDIETDISVDCKNFESYLDYKLYSENNHRTIHKLMKELNKLDMSPKSFEDIRCKLEFFFEGKICNTICIGRVLTKIGADYYYTSSKLKTIIDHIMKNIKEPWKQEKVSWAPDSCISKFYQYLNNHSECLYNNLVIEHDLNFMVLCNIYGGKTVDVRFSKVKDSEKIIIPDQIISVIKDILYQQITWDTPPYYKAQWIPINITIKSNIRNSSERNRDSEI